MPAALPRPKLVNQVPRLCQSNDDAHPTCRIDRFNAGPAQALPPVPILAESEDLFQCNGVALAPERVIPPRSLRRLLKPNPRGPRPFQHRFFNANVPATE